MGEGLARPSIKARCPACGDVVLVAGDIRVIVHERLVDGSYVFRCPDCRLAVSQPADSAAIEILVLAGSALILCAVPAEVSESHDGPPLCADDLIDFHFQLQDDDWFGLVCPVGGEGHPAG